MSILKSLALALALVTTAVFADQVALKDGHPDRYVVVKGDTLWDISGKFLESPWLWPEIWYVNPQIENPQTTTPHPARQGHVQTIAESTRRTAGLRDSNHPD